MDLCRLYQASAALPYIAEALERVRGETGAALRTAYAEKLVKLHDGEHLGRFEALLEAAVDLNKIPDEYVICASYDAELGELQKLKDAAEEEIHEAFREAADDLRLQPEKVLKLEHNNMHGWYLRLTKKDETTVRKKLTASYQVLEAKKDGTKFTNKKLRAPAASAWTWTNPTSLSSDTSSNASWTSPRASRTCSCRRAPSARRSMSSRASPRRRCPRPCPSRAPR